MKIGAITGVSLIQIAAVVFTTSNSLSASACTEEQFRMCPIACASVCENEEFLRAHAVLCSVSITQSRSDPPECQKLTGNSSNQTAAENSPFTESASNSDCSELPDLERKICEAGFPACAGSVPALKKKSELLAAETKTELNKFSEILTKDFSPESPQELCKFRIQELKRFYQLSVGKPGKLASFAGRYSELIKCVEQVDSWVRTYQINNTLLSQVQASIKPEIEGLKTGMGETNKNVKRIASMAPVLEKLIVVHSFICPSVEGE
jgi:hypothetical protein